MDMNVLLATCCRNAEPQRER